jgi:amiloride-sensitive sodium channel
MCFRNIHFEYMSLICSAYPEINENYTTFSDKFYDFIDEVKPAFSIYGCTYKGKPLSCEKIFKPVLTEEGVCYTFNMLDRSEIFRNNV